MGDGSYWNHWVGFSEKTISKKLDALVAPAANETYEAQFLFDLSRDNFRLLLRRYSRGDTIRELGRYLSDALSAWERSNQLAERICCEHNLKSCRDWTFELSNLNHYNWCFWLVGLALALEIPEEQWQRLLTLIGGEGEDVLLDRVIASRQPFRKVGTQLLHTKPYTRLLETIDASREDQAVLLLSFVEHWYGELKRKGKDELWWYNYGDAEKHPLEKGSYFGRWCIEAVAAVKAFGIDESLCLGHENYPGDLLRPDGPSTHLVHREQKKSWLLRLFGK
ncbi:PoNe immunity protein domain-containing protein [Pseudomonas indica]|uniref:DUF1911 domain-containing protein n=1 Tax=Pseudomonas indica TaxID=137658 RepID=A0A1G9JNN1_9PSED|nr:PoNe immunity protein domain-containing protein [Pseudomonas indica]SDL39138.1 protein of unknown function [Pseudomonas indica]